MNTFEAQIESALASLDGGDPDTAIEFLQSAQPLAPDLDARKLVEKAMDEARIGDPQKAETFLEMVLHPTGGSIAFAQTLPAKSAHTPGPWTISNGSGLVKTPSIVSERRNPDYPVKSSCALIARNIATMTIHGPEAENAANARLIAAAPDILAALEIIYEGCKHAGLMAQAGRAAAAIAKAKGTP